MQNKFEWPEPEEEADEILLRNIRKHGCHIMGIAGDEHVPNYAFSIGLFVNYGHAEIILFGLEGRRAASIINVVRDRAAAGQKYAVGDVADDILVGQKACFVEVPLQLYDKYLGTAIWFYRRSPRPFPCLQLVWPDDDGRFPWETGYDAGLKVYQPLLKSFS
jgi:hypothetical protein